MHSTACSYIKTSPCISRERKKTHTTLKSVLQEQHSALLEAAESLGWCVTVPGDLAACPLVAGLACRHHLLAHTLHTPLSPPLPAIKTPFTQLLLPERVLQPWSPLFPSFSISRGKEEPSHFSSPKNCATASTVHSLFTDMPHCG